MSPSTPTGTSLDLEANRDYGFATDLLCSQNLRLIPRADGSHVAYHTLFGNLTVINEASRQLLSLFDGGTPPDTLRSAIVDHSTYVREFYDLYYLVDAHSEERADLRKSLKERERAVSTGRFIGGVQLSVSDTCNFACPYCFCDYVDKRGVERLQLSKRKDKLMSFTMASQVIDTLIEQVKHSGKDALMIKFFGREPLVNWPVIKQILSRYGDGRDRDVLLEYAITTNGSLVNNEIADWLARYRVRTTVSIDGLKASNDRVRLGKGGRGTFDAIERGIGLLSEHRSLHVFSAVITDQNFDRFDKKFIEFAKSFEVHEVQILLGMQGDFIDRIDSETIVDKLLDLYLHGKNVGVAVTGYWYNAVIEALATRKRRGDREIRHSVIESCTATGYQVSVEPSGDVFPCRAMSTHMGHIAEFQDLLDSDAYRRVVMRTYGNVKECRGCALEGLCQGECLGNVEEKFGDIYSVDTTYCDIYRKIYEKILASL